MTGALSLVLVTAGLACFGLTLPQHWRQWSVHDQPGRGMVTALRLVATAALSGALLLSMRNAHPTIGVLVWVMELALGAVLVALVFASRPARAGQKSRSARIR